VQKAIVDVACREPPEAGAELARSLRASGPRVALLPQAGALAGAAALADGSEVVTGRAREAVLRKALEMARDARRDLVRAGELQKAGLADEAIASIEAVVK
jgi:hypothetical protein